MAYKILDETGSPITRDNKEVFGMDFSGVVKSIDKSKRILVITGTDETKDRDGDIISVNGWQMENFLKNPVFLYAHNYSSVPIGAAIKVVKKRDPKRLEFHEKFPTEGLYPFADLIFEMFREKFLNASSVGFIPLEWEPIEDKDENKKEEWRRGRKYIKQELLELSACPVPSNPSALQNYIKRSFGGMTGNSLLEKLSDPDFTISPWPDKVDEVKEELEIKEIEYQDEEKIQVQVPDQLGKTNDEELLTIKGQFEAKKEEIKQNEIEQEVKMEELKGMVKTLIDTNESLKTEIESIKLFLSEIIDFIKAKEEKQDQSEDNDLENIESDVIDEYGKLLSQKDNEQDKEDELSEEEKLLIETSLKTIREKLLKSSKE